MRIRRASVADAPALRRLWDAFTEEATFTPYPGSPFEPALVTDHVALVAEEESGIVGTVYASLASPGFGYVFGLYTVPVSRQRGVATALLRAAAAEVRGAGREHVVLSVDTQNERARAFYDRLGFADAARLLRIDVERLLAG
jgi:ribosomal protein S18 acetylase RimI-like enzyme